MKISVSSPIKFAGNKENQILAALKGHSGPVKVQNLHRDLGYWDIFGAVERVIAKGLAVRPSEDSLQLTDAGRERAEEKQVGNVQVKGPWRSSLRKLYQRRDPEWIKGEVLAHMQRMEIPVSHDALLRLMRSKHWVFAPDTVTAIAQLESEGHIETDPDSQTTHYRLRVQAPPLTPTGV